MIQTIISGRCPQCKRIHMEDDPRFAFLATAKSISIKNRAQAAYEVVLEKFK